MSAHVPSERASDEPPRRRMLSIVIPAYNEQENVQTAYERLREVVAGLDLDWELIFSVANSNDLSHLF